MSAVDSLEDGYEYCNCHPETCTHFGGVMWVGVKHKNKVVENLTIPKDFCVICGYEISFGDAISGACGNCNWQLD